IQVPKASRRGAAWYNESRAMEGTKALVKGQRKMEMEEFRKTPLWDSRLPVEERLDYLISEMTIEEKLSCLCTGTPALPRFGIERQFIGSEAAHGVEARHDQGKKRDPEATTSFPQPIGMSASWDPELLRQAGEVVGKEARVLYQRCPVGGLFRWAPTVDMERDPRWGRNEEGYGEDPYLTGKMAGAYVRGMQGEDPDHLLISSALKHFEANNVENGRGIKSSALDAANRYDYYYEPFRRVIEEAGVTSLMTAYNAVNGVTSILDHRVNELIREKWGLRGHVVSDGAALSMETDNRHETNSHAEALALALKAGVDCMTDNQELVRQAAQEAYQAGMITEEEIDRALRHSFGTKLRLGLYDAWDKNPWNHVEESVMDSAEHQNVSLRLAEESLVLLKNDGILPLSEETNVCLIGPLSNRWFQDWYGGEPNRRVTVRDGVCALTKTEPAMDCGLDLVLLRAAVSREFAVRISDDFADYGDAFAASESFADDGNTFAASEPVYVCFNADGLLTLTADRSQAEPFYYQDWGDNSITFYAPRRRKYICVHDDGLLAADQEIPFGWFVHECFHWGEDASACSGQGGPGLIPEKPGSLPEGCLNGCCASSEVSAAGRIISTWYGAELTAREDGLLSAKWRAFEERTDASASEKSNDEKNGETQVETLRFVPEVLEDGLARAEKLATESETVILVLGNCPVINGKEEVDRPSIQFPPQQQALAQAVYAKNPRTVLILQANYPYAVDWEQENLPAILLTATGSQDLGTAVANALYRRCAPAGRLNMTWYPHDALPPDVDDYDIRKTRRTYRYYDGKPLYPFGHGLTYGEFVYETLSVQVISAGQDEREMVQAPSAGRDEREMVQASSAGQDGCDMAPVSSAKQERCDMAPVSSAKQEGDIVLVSSAKQDGCDRASASFTGLELQLSITNFGACTSDEVVQIYVRGPQSRIKKPIQRLIAFRREHDVRPGESREVSFSVPRTDLRIYDVARADFIIEEGMYQIEVGASSGDIRLQKEIFLPGDRVVSRPRGRFVSVDHWDEYENLILGKGPDTGKAGGSESCSAMAGAQQGTSSGWARYEGIDAAGKEIGLSVTVAPGNGGRLWITSGEQEACIWRGSISGGRSALSGTLNARDTENENNEFTDGFSAEYWKRFTGDFCTIKLTCTPVGDDLTFHIEGDVRFAGFRVEA
ncbi:MAG: glycoside hydrolase family 3 C-terminal domain-containing protein, partial [Lachnospiraceae bacterium]|nr:glycoside hydrolase family 3 C-terminal domain-containing protein [Lachnospiraceae bacterium]